MRLSRCSTTLGSWQTQDLTGRQRRGAEVVALLELPDTLPNVARVAVRGDRPEGVGRLDDVRPLGPGGVGAAGDQTDRESREHQHDDKLPEHVFAILERTDVRVK